jgi:hypothetical protein
LRLLYRVFPWRDEVGDHEPGGALYIPFQGGGRLDNPGVYSVLYLSNSPAGAIAEAFGRFPEWSPAILQSGSAARQSVRAVGVYALHDEAAICDLDDPQRLLELALRPSDVVTRDYDRTRAWARRIWEQGTWTGVSWWSYHDPRWASVGLWNIDGLKVQSVRQLRLNDADLLEASRVIVRPITSGRKR